MSNVYCQVNDRGRLTNIEQIFKEVFFQQFWIDYLAQFKWRKNTTFVLWVDPYLPRLTISPTFLMQFKLQLLPGLSRAIKILTYKKLQTSPFELYFTLLLNRFKRTKDMQKEIFLWIYFKHSLLHQPQHDLNKNKAIIYRFLSRSILSVFLDFYKSLQKWLVSTLSSPDIFKHN